MRARRERKPFRLLSVGAGWDSLVVQSRIGRLMGELTWRDHTDLSLRLMRRVEA